MRGAMAPSGRMAVANYDAALLASPSWVLPLVQTFLTLPPAPANNPTTTIETKPSATSTRSDPDLLRDATDSMHQSCLPFERSILHSLLFDGKSGRRIHATVSFGQLVLIGLTFENAPILTGGYFFFPGSPAGFSWVRSRKLPRRPAASETADSPKRSRIRSAAASACCHFSWRPWSIRSNCSSPSAHPET